METDPGSTLALDREQRRTFRLGVANGAIGVGASAFYAPETVLGSLADALTGSSILVGLMITGFHLGWQWPQFFSAPLVENVERKLTIYKLFAVARVLMLLVAAAVLFTWRGPDLALYWVVLGLMWLFSSLGGAVAIPFMDIIAKGVPKHDLSIMWAYRRALGGLLGFGCSLVVAAMLPRDPADATAADFAPLLVLAAAVNATAFSLFARVRERIEPVRAHRPSMLTFLRRGPRILRRDHEYRRLFYYRAAWAGAVMGHAVLVPFASRYFAAPPSQTGGWFTGVVLVTGAVTSYIWGHTARRRDEKTVFRLGALCVLISALVAVLVALGKDTGVAAPFLDRHYLVFFVLMYVASTAGLNSIVIGMNTYLLHLPAPGLRPTYLAFMSVLSLPLLFAPVAAGALVEWVGFAFTFAVSAGMALVCVVLAGHLHPRGDDAFPVTDLGG
jgi:MFS family permease